MRNFARKRFSAWIVPVFSIALASSHLAIGSSIQIPCLDAGAPSSALCGLPLSQCSIVKPQMIRLLKRHFGAKIDGYYRGIDMDFNASSAENSVGSPFPGVCDLLRSEGAETIQDHLGISCGTPAKIGVSTNFLGFVNGINVDLVDSHGSRESSYTRGAWVQALVCHEQDVIAEIQSGTLSISPACQGMASDVQRLLDAAKLFLKNGTGTTPTLSSSPSPGPSVSPLPSHSMFAGGCAPVITDDSSCGLPSAQSASPVPEESIAPQASDSPAPPDQNKCYLVSLRHLMETGAINNVAACEVFARASQSFNWGFLSSGAQSEIQDSMNQTVTIPCGNEVKSQCGSRDSNCVRNHMQHCFESRYQEFFRHYMQRHLPHSGQCSVPPFPLFGGILLIRRRRKRGRRTSRDKRILLPMLGAFALFSASCNVPVSVLSACYGRDGVLINDDALAARCCEGSQEKLPYPKDCPQPPDMGMAYNYGQGVMANALMCTQLRNISALEGAPAYLTKVLNQPCPNPSPSPPLPSPSPSAATGAE